MLTDCVEEGDEPTESEGVGVLEFVAESEEVADVDALAPVDSDGVGLPVPVFDAVTLIVEEAVAPVEMDGVGDGDDEAVALPALAT